MDDLLALKAALAHRWAIERKLGQGGMAAVYLARDLKHERPVAIKVLRPELAASLGPDRFIREIRIAAQFAHPHILPLFDSAEVDGRLLYVMPYVAGESLRDRLARETRLPIADAVEIAREVAGALDYAHGHGIVHRDIKPENILLQAGQAVVADFGIAHAVDAAVASDGRLTETGVAIGSPRYMSPEQVAGDPVTGASDLYALGCVLYEMLAGSAPYEGGTARSVLAGHATAEAPSVRQRRPEVSPDLDRIVRTLMAKDPADRFPTGASLIQALGSTRQGRGTDRPAARAARYLIGPRTIGIGILAAAGIGLWRSGLVGGGEIGARRASLAVLYLENLSRDSADQYLVDGLTEEMITRLGQLERLSIPSRGTVRRYRGRDLDPADVGRQLGVDYLVSGSLERSGPRLRVRLELVEASSGRQMWGGTFTQDGGDVLAIQDSIAPAVAVEVAGRLAPRERSALANRPTRNLQAYDHYLRGNFYLSRRTGEADGRRALEEYRTALRLDPTFAGAHAGLGLVYGIYAGWPWPFPGLTTDSLVALGLAAANRAIALDSSNVEGWIARGFALIPGPADPSSVLGFQMSPTLLFTGTRCWSNVPDCHPKAVDALARAVRLAPRNAEAWYQYGRANIFTPSGDSAIQRSLMLEPDRAVSGWLLGLSLLGQGRPETAEPMLDSAIALGRRDRSVHALRLEARLARGDLSGAAADLDRIRALATDSVSALYHAAMSVALAAKRGDSAEARARLDSLLRRSPPDRIISPIARVAIAAAMVAAGARERALDKLGVLRLPGGTWALRSPVWDPIRSDPRFPGARSLSSLRP